MLEKRYCSSWADGGIFRYLWNILFFLFTSLKAFGRKKKELLMNPGRSAIANFTQKKKTEQKL